MIKVIAVTGHLLALLFYVLGLLSPLTPSEGMPETGALLWCVVLPLLLLFLAWCIYRHWLAQTLVLLQILVVVGFTGWLLMLQSGMLSAGYESGFSALERQSAMSERVPHRER